MNIFAADVLIANQAGVAQRLEREFCKLDAVGSNPSTGSISFLSFREFIMLDKAELEHLVEEGLSIRNIAVCLGVSYTTVRYWLKKFGLRSKGREPKPLCKNCGAVVKRRPNQYCSNFCCSQLKRRIKAESDPDSVDPRLLKNDLC